MLVLLALEPTLGVAVLHTSLVDELVTTARVLNGVLPLQVQLVSFLMQTFEFFCGLVQLDLGGLRLSHFLFQLGCLASDLDGEFLDLEGELLDFGLVGAAELLESEVVFLFLAGGKGPLLQFLLVPVHFELELVHALVRLEDHVLNVVQAVLLVSDALFKLLNLVAQTAALSLSNLLEVLLSLNFFVLGVDEALRVHELHLDRLEMLFKNFEALLMLLDLQAQLSHQAHFLPDDLVQFLVLVVGIGWEVLVQVVLRDRVHDVVSHVVPKLVSCF